MPRFILLFILLLSLAATPFDYVTDTVAVRTIIDSCGKVWLDINGDTMHFNIQQLTDSVNGRIRSLHFARFQGTRLHPIIGNLTELETLDLSGNYFDTFPHTLFTLTNLRSLRLTGIPLDSIPRAIGNLTNLGELFVNACKGLTPGGYYKNGFKTLPDEIGNLVNLEYLNCEYNALESLPSSIGNLKKLYFLDMLQNKITFLPDEIGNLDSLWIIEASLNSLNRLPSSIGKLRKLAMLTLNNNSLSSLPDSIMLISPQTFGLDSNNLCSLPCYLQNWVDTHVINGVNWRWNQRCAVVPVPHCSSSVFHRPSFRVPENHLHPASIYDIRGRYIGVSKNGLLPGSCRVGIYILRSDASSGKKMKMCVVK